MRYRWGLDNSVIKYLEETAKEFGISKERVQQIEMRWLNRINLMQNQEDQRKF